MRPTILYENTLRGGYVTRQTSDENDAALQQALRAVIGGDTDAFSHIVRICASQVERLVSAHVSPQEVPEVAQEVFVRAYNSLSSYTGRGAFRHWLAVIAVRCCHERLRQRYRPETAFSALGMEEDDRSAEERLTEHVSLRRHDEENEQRALREMLDQALTRLAPTDRMLVTLTYFEGHTLAEAADMLHISAINARVRMHRSKVRLRALLTAQEETPS